jgi:hypothetical protein
MTTMYKCSEASTGTTRFEDKEVFFLLLIQDFILRDEAATKRLLFLYPKRKIFCMILRLYKKQKYND